VQGIPVLIQGAIQLVTALVAALPEIVQALIDAMPQIIQAIADALPTLVPTLIEGSIQLTLALVAAFPQIIAILVASLPQIIEAIVQGFATLGPALAQTFSQAMASVLPAFNQLGTAAQNAWNTIKQAFSQVGSWFKQQFNNAVNGVKNAWNGITAFFKQIWEQIKGVFNDAVSKFGEIGKNIVDGMKKGIEGAWDSLSGWVKDKVGGLVDGVKDALKIESPSKVFADEVGQWIPAGIAMGIENGMGVLDDQIKTMTDEALVGTVTATTQSVSAVNYVPNTPIQSQDDRMYQLLAQYLPVLADKDFNIDIKQNDRGTYEIVRQQNMILTAATGYHALA
jgi:phage-related protein